jgi:hypothetical protein
MVHGGGSTLIKDGFLPQSSPPDQGEIREREAGEGGRRASPFDRARRPLL